MQKLIPIIALSAHPYTASIAPRASEALGNEGGLGGSPDQEARLVWPPVSQPPRVNSGTTEDDLLRRRKTPPAQVRQRLATWVDA
jgi:hypothetical protein